MTNADTRNRHGITPRLLRRERAAAYIDVSPGSFDKLVKDGRVPPPKRYQMFKAWDRVDLDAYIDSLPYDGASTLDTSWDD